MRREYYLSLGMGLALFLSAGREPGAQAFLQEPHGRPPAREAGEQGERAFGSITSVGVDRFEIKKLDGAEQTILVDEQTRFRQGEQEIQLEDLKLGDRVFVRRRSIDDKEILAQVVRRVTDEESRRFQAGGERAFGEIVAIEKDQLKIRNRFQADRIVFVSDQTTIQKEGQTISFEDLKVGDRIFAMGKESDGKFVATEIRTGQFPQGRGARRQDRENEKR